jgi:hypothetical protein
MAAYDSEEEDIDYNTFLDECREQLFELFMSDPNAIAVYVAEMARGREEVVAAEAALDEADDVGDEGVEWEDEDADEGGRGMSMIDYLEAQREAKYQELAKSITMDSNPLYRAQARNAELEAADAAVGDKYTEEQWKLFWQMNPNRHYNKDFDIKNLGSDLAMFRIKVSKMREKVRLDIERFNNKSRVSDRTKLFEQMAPKTIDQWT